MIPTLTKQKKDKFERGGLIASGVFGALAGGAAAVTLVPAAIGLTALALASFGVAIYGFAAREDVTRFARLSFRAASPDDLDRFHARLATFTSSVVPLSERHKISDKNSKCFRVIEDIRDDDWRRSVDILALYPLTQAAVDEVLKGKIRGSDIRAEHVAKSFRTALGLYVSFAEGVSFTTRGLIIREIEKTIAEIRRRPLPVATIPTTPEALVLVTNKGFIGLDGGPPRLKEVCTLQFQE